MPIDNTIKLLEEKLSELSNDLKYHNESITKINELTKSLKIEKQFLELNHI